MEESVITNPVRVETLQPPAVAAGDGPAVHGYFEDLAAQCRARPPLTVAVAYPVDEFALRAVADAHLAGIVAPLLVGPSSRIADVASSHGIDVVGMSIIEASDAASAAAAAVAAVRDGRADLLMKGSLHTSAFLHAVLDRTSGLRGPGRASHAFVCDVPAYGRPLFVTDAVVNVRPSLPEKAAICRNVIALAQSLGIARPKVAVLSATEVVDPAIPSTLDAAALSKMADRGEIAGAILDGPLALDDAISEAAIGTKGISSPVGGDADALVVPNLEAGNILYKSLVYMAGAEVAGVVLGLQVPLVLTSRADTVRTRVASAALACTWARTTR